MNGTVNITTSGTTANVCVSQVADDLTALGALPGFDGWRIESLAFRPRARDGEGVVTLWDCDAVARPNVSAPEEPAHSSGI